MTQQKKNKYCLVIDEQTDYYNLSLHYEHHLAITRIEGHGPLTQPNKRLYNHLVIVALIHVKKWNYKALSIEV